MIVGAGFTGIQLAKRLVNGKNDVVLIDNDENTVRHASNRLDCNVIQADGNNLETLEEAGIEKADALVCVTSSDEVNMITCSLVDSVYPKILKIARVRNYAYYVNTSTAAKKHATVLTGEHRPLYGIDFMVHPDVEAAQAIISAVEHGAIMDSISFDDSPYELVRIGIEAESRFDGIALQNIRKVTEKRFLISYLESNGETTLPSGGSILKAGDFVGILLKREDLPDFLNLCGSKVKEIRKIALVGANRIGMIVAEKLIHTKKSKIRQFLGLKSKLNSDFVIVDSDEENAKAAAEKFPDIRVFNADVTEEGFVEEEGIDKFDLVICCTQNYEMNIVMAAFIESLGVKNSVALVANSAFGEIARRLDIEVAVPIRDSVVDSIIGHLRGESVTGVHSVNGSLEIVEITIPENSEVNGKELKEIAENGAFLIMQIQKSGEKEFTIPYGNAKLGAGDKIIVITNAENNEHVMKKFGSVE